MTACPVAASRGMMWLLFLKCLRERRHELGCWRLVATFDPRDAKRSLDPFDAESSVDHTKHS